MRKKDSDQITLRKLYEEVHSFCEGDLDYMHFICSDNVLRKKTFC